jgi:predicted membrane GTPase involved in stress response
MILSLFTRTPAPPSRHPRRLMHPECPIEQMLRGRTPQVREALVEEAWRRRPPESHVLYIGDHRGLRILARSECALAMAIAELAVRYGEGLEAEPPTVRYVHGSPVLEPWMSVTVNAPQRFRDEVEQDLNERRGQVRRLTPLSEVFVMEGEAPLADLLGYEDGLAGLTDNDAFMAAQLSRYVPIDQGPRAA